MNIVTAPTQARQHSPVELTEDFRSKTPVPDGTFRVVTTDDSSTEFLAGAFVGTFDAAMRHALTCARSIRSRFNLSEAACRVHDSAGRLVYAAAAHGGGIRVRRIPG